MPENSRILNDEILNSNIKNDIIASTVIKIFENHEDFILKTKVKNGCYDIEINYQKNLYDNIFGNNAKSPFALYVGKKKLTFWFRKEESFFRKFTLPVNSNIIKSTSPNHRLFKIYSIKDLAEIIKYVFIDSLKSNSINFYKLLEDSSKSEFENKVNIVEDGKSLNLSRRGQQQYKNNLLIKWGFCCSVTELNNTSLLIASHIKPYSKSSPIEKYDTENGLLLIPNLDSLFDKFLISFGNDGTIIISNTLSNDDYIILGISKLMRLKKVTKGMLPYLTWHRSKLVKN
ncbi:HNH endonuclease [Polaribacter sp. R2A056_3_33]|uniref:HNH endonuclease n=1 Tax=Polaribacter sp. R2A056_3_33 TaxID=2745563 RepID=UPI001C4EEEFC|nr:HNH endonuclease signature motif containing protein [Polaribacter sp. R2A056_3_33]QXP69995.1 HNH endonuclease [Polaribacter sp. R2A056_3_33]